MLESEQPSPSPKTNLFSSLLIKTWKTIINICPWLRCRRLSFLQKAKDLKIPVDKSDSNLIELSGYMIFSIPLLKTLLAFIFLHILKMCEPSFVLNRDNVI